MNRREAIQRVVGVLAGLPVVGRQREYLPPGWVRKPLDEHTRWLSGSNLWLGKPVGTIWIANGKVVRSA